MHGSMGGGRRPATVGHAARRQAPLAYPTNLRLHEAAVVVSDADVLAASVVVVLRRHHALEEVVGVGLLGQVDHQHRGAIDRVAASDDPRVVVAPALAEARFELVRDPRERLTVAGDDLVPRRRRPDHVARAHELGARRARPARRRIRRPVGLVAAAGQAGDGQRDHDQRSSPHPAARTPTVGLSRGRRVESPVHR